MNSCQPGLGQELAQVAEASELARPEDSALVVGTAEKTSPAVRARSAAESSATAVPSSDRMDCV